MAAGADDDGQGSEEPIPLSALQHAVYCLCQAALIHIERLWADNRFTAEGNVLHAVADKGGRTAPPQHFGHCRCGRVPAVRGRGNSFSH